MLHRNRRGRIREGRAPTSRAFPTGFGRMGLSRPAERLLQCFHVGLKIGDTAELKVEIVSVSADVRLHLIDERTLTQIRAPQPSDCGDRGPSRRGHDHQITGHLNRRLFRIGHLRRGPDRRGHVGATCVKI